MAAPIAADPGGLLDPRISTTAKLQLLLIFGSFDSLSNMFAEFTLLGIACWLQVGFSVQAELCLVIFVVISDGLTLLLEGPSTSWECP